jgi:cytochrome c-type biogenesis protein CcmE
MSTTAKIGVTVAVVIGAVGYMIYTTVSSGDALEYFKHVEEVTGAANTWKGQRLQVHGNIVAGTIAKTPASMDFLFALHREGQWLDVKYHGLVPDNFRDCAELVVKGRVVDDHTFAADEISAKCPSKYDGKRNTGCGHELRPQVLARRK